MSTHGPELTARQRSAPPINRHAARRGLAAGGYDRAAPATLAPGLETELTRYPGTANDAGVTRDRRPFYSTTADYVPPPLTWVNWTLAGPARAELHMRTVDLRSMVGNSTGRYPYVPGAPTGGRHTMTPAGPGGSAQTRDRYVGAGLPQMRAARPDRLAPARYTGQSYSQTTAVQGGRGGR